MHAALRRPRLLGDHRAGRRAARRPRARARCARSRSTSSATRTPSPPTRCATPPTRRTSASSPSTWPPTTRRSRSRTTTSWTPTPAPRCSRARDLPLSLGDMDTSLYLLFKAIRGALDGRAVRRVGRRGVRRLPLVPRPRGRQRRHLPLAGRHGRARWTSARELLPTTDLLRAARPPRLPSTPRTATRWPRCRTPRRRADPLERRMREICYLHLTRFVQILLDRKDRMSMAIGLEVRVPFCDHRLVQYVFNTPWALKTFDGREKCLLRAATRDVLPESIVAAREDPVPVDPGPGLREGRARRPRRPRGRPERPGARAHRRRRGCAPRWTPRARTRRRASRSTARRWRTCSSSTRG